MSKDNRKNVVVVGGGSAGSLVARTLSAKLDPSRHNLILVTARKSYVFLIAAARMVVTSEGNLEDSAILPYDKLFTNGNGTHIIGTVTSIEDVAPGKAGNVVLNNGEKVHYDVLVLATGSVWPGPLNFPDSDADARTHINEWRTKFSNAKHVVIAGGGAVGIETAGEVKAAFPDKKVTIVHADGKLVNDTYPDKWRDDLERRARKKGIEIILGDKVDTSLAPGSVGVVTSKGREIPDADLIVPSFGSRPNTGYFSSLDESAITSNGFVKVEPTFQVKNHPGIFALGDIIDWPEQKQAAKANAHAAIVAENVLSYVSGQPAKKIYKGSPELIVVPIGKDGGSGYLGILWGIIVGDWLTKILKAKTLMVPMARKQFGCS